MTDLIVRGLTCRFGELTVLEDFSARFPAGTTTCVMGPSGRGKTTLLRVLMGLLTPAAGTVTGRPERIRAVFQEDRLLEEFSVADNLRFVSPKLTRQAIDAHLAAVGLGENREQPVAELSGGMKRRVAIVRAVLAEGELLLLDEPFRGLDQATRAVVADYLRCHTRGVTTILVTHDPEEVPLMEGRLLQL